MIVNADPMWPNYATPDDLAAIESVPLEARGLPESTYAALRRAGTKWPDQLALAVLPDGANWKNPVERTFGELLADVTRAANLLHSFGVGRQSAVAVISPNCEQLITATLAAQLAGIVAPVNSALPAEHVIDLVRRSKATVLVAASPDLDPASWQLATNLVAAGLISTVLLLRPTGADPGTPAPPIDGAHVAYLDSSAVGHDSHQFGGTEPGPSDLAALIHTGGTTGSPKLAAHTQLNEVSNAWMIAAMALFDETSVVFAALPLFHVNALVVTVISPLLRGQKTVWAGPLGYRDPRLYPNFWRIAQHYRLTTMSAVPTVYAALTLVPVDADISTLELAISGASPLPPTVRIEFERHTAATIVEGYGLTEGTAATARTFPDRPVPGSVGQRLPYQQVKTVAIDHDGRRQDLAVGEIGHLLISGPTVFAGYVVGDVGNVVLDDLGTLEDGWLDTGDMARVDEEGFVYLTGRAKDLIIRGGHNIDPAQIEDALLAHPGVTGAAAVGRPDPRVGELPVAYVVLDSDSVATESELLAWAAAHIGERAAVPKTITIIDAIPLTAVGKPHKLGLRARTYQRAIEESLQGSRGVSAVDALIDDGTVTVVVCVESDADRPSIQRELDRFAIASHIRTAAGPSEQRIR